MAATKTGFAAAKGKAVVVRTVTYHYTGIVVGVEDGFLRLTKAAWIADSGRWNDALRDGAWEEVEPYIEDCYVALGAIVDWTRIKAAPTEQR